MHLAAAGALLAAETFADPERFRLGCLLPDAYAEAGRLRPVTHFRRQEGNKGWFDLETFRTRYACQMRTDDLWLGYYLHLLQDTLYRPMVLEITAWDPQDAEQLETMHADYRGLNAYVARTRGLTPRLVLPESPSAESVNGIYPFGWQALADDLAGDFACEERSRFTYLTPAFADRFIDTASEACLRELHALRSGGPLTDPRPYAWDL